MRSKTRIIIVQLLVGSIFVVLVYKLIPSSRCSEEMDPIGESYRSYEEPADFECFDNKIGSRDGFPIVPNIVHFIRWNQQFSFLDAICVLAAYRNQRPERLIIHTDLDSFDGKYWEMIRNEPGIEDVLEVKHLAVPTEIFDQELNSAWKYWHGGDIARIQVLMKYGGIFLDNDSFLVKSLDEYRKFELTLGWQPGLYLANQAVLAHKNARFLEKWLNSYRHRYYAWGWYYNTGERPTTDILEKEPHLIHRVDKFFCEYTGMMEFLYLENHSNWSEHYVIHLLSRHTEELVKNLSAAATYPVVFDEYNIAKYNATIRQIVNSVYNTGHT